MARYSTPAGSALRESHQFSIGVFGLPITLVGNCPRTVLKLRRHLLPWLPRLPRPSAPARHLIFAIRRGPAPGRFRLERNDSLLASDVTEPCLPALLQGAIEEAIIENPGDFAAVHSGVIVHNGVAVLLPGQSQSG
jgi:hypothetical protein